MDIQLANGLYRGFTFSDNAPQVFCEMQMELSTTEVVLRVATGTEVHTETIARDELIGLTTEQIASHFNSASSADDAVGMSIGEEGVRFILTRPPTDAEIAEMTAGIELAPGQAPPQPIDAPRLLVLGLPGQEAFGESILFTPEQVAAGSFDRFLVSFGLQFGEHMFPRVEYGGKPVPSNSAS